VFGNGPPGLAEGAAALGRSAAGLRMAHGKGRVVEFQYTANSFIAPGRARYRYKLEPVDEHWSKETSERTVHYISLPPGDYTFQVIGGNAHNVWNLQPATFSFSIDPRFWQTWTFYGLCASTLIGLTVIVQAYRLRWQRRLLKLEEQRTVANERARIARDLHDDLGTALTGLALELDVVGKQEQATTPIANRLKSIAQSVRDLAERMREVVWTVNPKCDSVSSLATFLEQQVGQFLNADGIEVRLDFPEEVPDRPLGAEARHQLALAMREALTNVVRHSQATQVTIYLTLEPELLTVRIQDNGKGFEPGTTSGNGLTNMRARLQQAGGSFACVSKPGSGTLITMQLPLPRPTAGPRQGPPPPL